MLIHESISEMLKKIVDSLGSIIAILIFVTIIILVLFGVQYFMENILWMLLLALASMAWLSALIHLMFFNSFLTLKQKVSWALALVSFIFTGIAVFMYWGQWYDNGFEAELNKKYEENIRAKK